jgi:hypothetical protein
VNALVPVNTAPAMTVSDVERVANAIAKGGLFGSKDPYAVLTLCLVAQAEGQHPAVVFRDYHIINGKPAKKAEAMLRDFLAASGRVEWHALTDEVADATFSHPYGGTARISWDHARAVKAQIAGNAMYKKYPRQMLRSRTISEGVRTVYPGATSGLYEEGEVASFTDSRAAEPHDPETGEIIEGETVERQKVPGIHKIKERLNELMRTGDKAASLDAFNALVGTYRDDLQKIKTANHEYWTGDGGDSEGFKAWIRRRREELAVPGITTAEESESFTMLRETMSECTSATELDAWFKLNSQYVETLDHDEQDRVKQLYDEKEAELARPAAKTPLEAGAFGG